MSPAEFMSAVEESRQRQEGTARDVVEFARHVVFTLKDRGAPALADELARRIHLYDSETAEASKLLADNKDAISAILMDFAAKRSRGER